LATTDKNVGLLFRGERTARDGPKIEDSRLAKVAAALAAVAITPHAVVFSEHFVDEVRDQLMHMDGVLVWVDPFTDQGDRTILDAMLREVADAGVWVSAHPDTILRIGTKSVLYATRTMGWGGDVHRFDSLRQLATEFPGLLAGGSTRVLKQSRGNGGHGVFKVASVAVESQISPVTPLSVRHARRGAIEQIMTMAELIEVCRPYFAAGGSIIDQPWQPRLPEGMVRCYLVGDKVVGFGEQLINALYPMSESSDPAIPHQPGPRLYYPPNRPKFQRLKGLLERDWVPQLIQLVGLGAEALPVIWDADFLFGPKTSDGNDTYVLCEINVSSVFPFPDEALEVLAAETAKTLRMR